MARGDHAGCAVEGDECVMKKSYCTAVAALTHGERKRYRCYNDPTADAAIANVMREEREREKAEKARRSVKSTRSEKSRGATKTNRSVKARGTGNTIRNGVNVYATQK